ncbi:MAG TPA: hypothetical protein VFG81_02370 [Anaerolineales bacterium]|jgi:hypothetical protein|nr:hypothetical protein [Anaerolineales bacterium]
MKTKALASEIGIGATEPLSLRVSVAALTRVLFPHPDDNEVMLALERKATLLEENGQRLVGIKAQPFGGALRIHDPKPLQDLIGEFHFDSEESRAEQDFRIFIRPEDWTKVREFCLGRLGRLDDSVLEVDPARELREEFADALKVDLKPNQYTYQTIRTIVEDQPSPTENVNARGYLTTRIYRIFEARILDHALASAMIENSKSCSDKNLRDLALQDSWRGGSGRTNAVLTLPLRVISDFYSTLPPEGRNTPAWFHSHLLDETVPATLDGISVPKYQRL